MGVEGSVAEVGGVGEVPGVFDVVGPAEWGGCGCGCGVGRVVDGLRECGCRRGEVNVLQRVTRVILCRRGFEEGAAVVWVRGQVESRGGAGRGKGKSGRQTGRRVEI